MPANIRIESVYCSGGNYALDNSATLYKPGELGARVTDGAGNEWQRVQCDSGATANGSAGVVAAGQLAYWKTKVNNGATSGPGSGAGYIVTNDAAQTIAPPAGNSEFRNEVAGVFGTAVTAGNYCFVQQRGRAQVKAASGGTYAPGNFAVANTGTAADATTVTAGTALTVLSIGIVAGARVAPNAPVDLQIPQVE